MELNTLAGLMSHPIITLALARLILYGQDGVVGVVAEVAVMAGVVFGLIGIPGGNQATQLN